MGLKPLLFFLISRYKLNLTQRNQQVVVHSPSEVRALPAGASPAWFTPGRKQWLTTKGNLHCHTEFLQGLLLHFTHRDDLSTDSHGLMACVAEEVSI